MSGFRINSATWHDGARTAALVNVTVPDGETFDYNVVSGDTAPMNVRLWDELRKGTVPVAENLHALVRRGEAPVPEGHALADGILVNVEAARRDREREINAELDRLYGGLFGAHAERSETFRRNRFLQVNILLDLPNQEGFPLDVDMAQLENKHIRTLLEETTA